MRFLFALLSLLAFVIGFACCISSSIRAQKWSCYTYNGQDVRVKDGMITTDHEIAVDTTQWEFVGMAHCSETDHEARSKFSNKKFETFKRNLEARRPSKQDFCLEPDEHVTEIRFLKKESNSLPISWGMELRESNFDSTFIGAIGYIDRGSGDPVMYEMTTDSTKKYYGYNNLLYNQLNQSLEF